MDDLISRQAAIDSLHRYFDGMHETDTWSPCDVYGLIEILPSVQPEIIRCKDCKHYNAGFECLIEGYGIERNKDWFCADAERRTDG